MNKLERKLRDNLINNEYAFGEEEWVSDILSLSELKSCKPWDIALQYPTNSYLFCLKNIDTDSDIFCSCWYGIHEDLYYYLHNKSKDMTWDDIEAFVGFVESDNV